MARQHTASQNLKSVASVALVGLGIVILFVSLDGPAAQLTHLLSSAARESLQLLPSFVPAARQALQAYAFDKQGASPCPLQMLVSLCPLLRVIAGAV